MHHDVHLIVLTPDGQDAVRLCDGKTPAFTEAYELGVDTFALCGWCVTRSVDDVRPTAKGLR